MPVTIASLDEQLREELEAINLRVRTLSASQLQAERKMEQLKKYRSTLLKHEPKALQLVRRPDYRRLKPTLIKCKKSDNPLWLYFRRTISSAPWNGRYGRQQRYFVMDAASGGVLGIVELCAEMLAMSLRDKFVGWTKEQRGYGGLNKVVNMGTCVSVAPFGRLCGGKFIAEAIISKKCRRKWHKAYGDPVCMFTTTSLYGKSSVYNRLPSWKYLGLTPGGSTFGATPRLRSLLNKLDKLDPRLTRRVDMEHGGVWGMALRVANRLGVKMEASIGHGKGVYVAPVGNGPAYLCGDEGWQPGEMRSVKDVADWWVERWYKMRLAKFEDQVTAWNPGELSVSAAYRRAKGRACAPKP